MGLLAPDETAVLVVLVVPLLFLALLPIVEVKVETVIILVLSPVLAAAAVLLVPVEMVMMEKMQIIL